MTYQPNVLNEYATYTYNISIRQIRGDQLDASASSGILVADSSRDARYNVVDIEQVFTVGYDRVRNGIGNEFHIHIHEPNGCTLLEQIAANAQEQNIRGPGAGPDHLSAKYVITVSFKGRTDDNSTPALAPSFSYVCQISDFTFNVSANGTDYRIKMIEHTETAFHYLNNVLFTQITIEAETFGEFISKLNNELHIASFRSWELNESQLLFDSHTFIIDDSISEWADWRFQQLDELNATSYFDVIGSSGNEKLQITLNNGSNLTEIIEMVLRLTKEYKRIPTSDGTFFKEQPNTNTGNILLDKLPAFFKIVSDITYNKYDPLRREYQKDISYTISRYTTTDLIPDPYAYVQSVTNETVQRGRVQQIIDEGLLVKRYDYLFTGNNTEILNLDLKFDNAYYYVVPDGAGLYGDPDVQSPQNYTDVTSVISRINATKQEVSNAAQELRDTRKLAEFSRTTPGIGPVVGSAIANDAAEQRRRLNDIRIEALGNIDELLGQLQEEFNLNPADINWPMPVSPDVIADDDISGPENDRRGGTLRFGAVRANLETSSDMVQIEMEIRGDPYWMGVPSNFRGDFGAGGIITQTSPQGIANWQRGAVSFFLRSFLPNPDDDAQGRRLPQPSYQVSGLYVVRSVINRFAGGQFTQYLSAVRDLGTNTSVAYQALDAGGQSNSAIDVRFGTVGTDPAQAQENAGSGLNLGLI